MRTRSLALPAAVTLPLLVAACASPSSTAAAPAAPAASPLASMGAMAASALSAAHVSRSASSPSPSAPSASDTASGDPLEAESANQIAQTAMANLRDASAVHVSGTVTDSGSMLSLDLTAGTTACAGTISEAGTGSFEIMQRGTTVWLKPDNQFWKSAANGDQSVLPLLEGKYIQTTTADKDLKSLSSLCDPAKLADLMGTPNDLVKEAATVINGQPALPLRDATDSAFIDVSDSPAPRLLRLAAGSDQQLNFSGYGVPATVTPPPASETLAGSQYGL